MFWFLLLIKNFRNLSTFCIKCWYWDWLCWGLMTCQPLWVILCCVPEKGSKEIVGKRWKRGTGKKEKQVWNGRNRRNKNIPPSTFTYYKDSRPCPNVSQYQLDAPVTQDTWHLCTTQPPPPREREKRARRDSRGDERETGKKEEQEWKWRNRRNKNIPLYHYLLQG